MSRLDNHKGGAHGMRLSALWWWIDRWRQSSAYTSMSLEEQGAYRNLLDEAWLRGGALEDDDDILAKACGDPRRWPKLRKRLMRHFAKHHDGWHNDILDAVLRQSIRRATNQRSYRDRIDNRATTTVITRRSQDR